MGDRDSYSWNRRINREGKALWELESDGFRAEPVQDRGEPAFLNQPSAPVEQVSTDLRADYAPLPDIQASRQRVAGLEQQEGQLSETVEGLTHAVEQTSAFIRQLEQQLAEQRAELQEHQNQLSKKQDELNSHRQMMESARQQLQNDLRQQQAQQEQQRQAAAQAVPQRMPAQVPAEAAPNQGLRGMPARMQQNILARTRERANVPAQARVTPLPENYQPAGWCFQKLQQHEGIPQEYAHKQLEDFKMYWLSTGEARKAWDYRFVKHVIYQWQRERGQGQGEERTARSQPTTQELTDRSWADRYDFDFD
ncbi:DnaT-like ssDNA-binding domain-containing protein [Parendozoicomonas haliclonae]|nr:DnaT-like ssDNA-binding domain-containing protein [Parendozoicomonas haliclonae]